MHRETTLHHDSLPVRIWRETDLWLRQRLELDLLREPKRIIDFHAEVTDGGFDLRLAE